MSGRIRKAIAGIGSILPQKYDAAAILKKVAEELATLAPAVEFVNADGWKLIRKRYQEEVVNAMKRRIVYLAGNADKNRAEIQHTSNIIGACDLLLDLTDNIIKAHQEALETTNHVKGTAGGE